MMLWAWGANNHGQLGLGVASEQEPVQVMASLPVSCEECRQIVGGGGHTALLTTRGHVYMTGCNSVGQLGLGHTGQVLVFTKLEWSETVVSVACGWDFTVLLTNNGHVYTAGSNAFGLNNDGLKFVNAFQKVEGVTNVVSISAGLRHAMCVTREGVVFGWGAGNKGQLGTGAKLTKQFCPVKTESMSSSATDTYCGQYFTLVKTVSGEVFGFGDNKFHQLTPDISVSTVMAPIVVSGVHSSDNISCGWTHVVLHSPVNGNVSVRGRDNYHQHGGAGQGDTVVIGAVSALSGSEHCLSVMSDGRLLTWGWNEHANCGLEPSDHDCVTTPTEVPGLTNVTRAFVGSAHCFALTDDNV